MKVLQYDNGTALVEVYLAPEIISKGALQKLVEKFEIMLFDFADDTNVFLKEVYRKKDYFAIIAIESEEFKHVSRISLEVEKRTKRVASLVKSSLFSAINHLSV